jgi:hypothetical protein
MSFTARFAKFARFSCASASTAGGDGPLRAVAAEGLNSRLNAEPSPEWNAMKLDELDGMGGVDQAELNQLGEALREFRLSVHAWTAQVQNAQPQEVLGWNEAVIGQPQRLSAGSSRPRVRQLALGWAMGCVLVAAGLLAGIWEHHRQLASLNAARVAEPHWMAPVQQGKRILEPGELAQNKLAQDRLAQDKPVQEAKEDLLARVDSDVSRQVPSAMEPLAELMAGNESQ